MAGKAKSKTPTIAQLLVVISEYNKAHELDLAELNSGAVAPGKNEFLENLYFAAANAAAALRPLLNVELGVFSAETRRTNKESRKAGTDVARRAPRIMPQTLAAVADAPLQYGEVK